MEQGFLENGFHPSRSSPLFSRDTIHGPGFRRTAYQEVGGKIEEEKGEKMENSILSAASRPFVGRHAPETAFARDDLRNSWNLEFRLFEIALVATKMRAS